MRVYARIFPLCFNLEYSQIEGCCNYEKIVKPDYWLMLYIMLYGKREFFSVQQIIRYNNSNPRLQCLVILQMTTALYEKRHETRIYR